MCFTGILKSLNTNERTKSAQENFTMQRATFIYAQLKHNNATIRQLYLLNDFNKVIIKPNKAMQ